MFNLTQSRYQSSVRKCEGNKYPKCSQTLLEACITTIASIDNTKWTCSTCKSKLTSGKLYKSDPKPKNGIPCETTMFKLDTFRRKINFSAYSIYADIWTP